MSSPDASDNHLTTLLSDTTLSTLQLTQQPFGAAASETETYLDDASLEQLADVKQALLTGDDLLLILGEAGAGKSVLLNQLGINSGHNIQCFAVKGSPRFSTLNLFAGMLEAFKHKPPEILKDILDELMPCLQTMVVRDTLSAIILDDADQVSESELTQLLSSMLYINSQDETLMRVALAAAPEFEDRIPDLLPEGADLPYSSLTIEGMDRERAADYLAFRLQQGGYVGELPFSEQDLDVIVSQSGGYPAAMHGAAANVLNQLYDPMQHPPLEIPQTSPKQSFLQSRNGKFGLGALAVILILGGLLMFTPDAADDRQRYVDNNATENETLSSDSFTQSNSLSANADMQNSAMATASPASDDRPSLRVIEQRKVVPFESQAIESLVPKVSQPSRRPSEQSDNPDSAPTTASVATNDTETAPETTSSRTEIIESDANETIIEEQVITEVASSNTLPENAQIPDVSETEVVLETSTESTLSTPDYSNTDDVSSNPIQTSTPNEVAEVDPELVDILESPTWILVQDSNLITVQMSASRNRKSIESFLKRNRSILPAPNSIYTFQRRGETWYALLHGLYSTFEEAQIAVERMPDSAVTDQPWIRNVGRVQDVLKAQ